MVQLIATVATEAVNLRSKGRLLGKHDSKVMGCRRKWEMMKSTSNCQDQMYRRVRHTVMNQVWSVILPFPHHQPLSPHCFYIFLVWTACFSCIEIWKKISFCFILILSSLPAYCYVTPLSRSRSLPPPSSCILFLINFSPSGSLLLLLPLLLLFIFIFTITTFIIYYNTLHLFQLSLQMAQSLLLRLLLLVQKLLQKLLLLILFCSSLFAVVNAFPRVFLSEAILCFT